MSAGITHLPEVYCLMLSVKIPTTDLILRDSDPVGLAKEFVKISARQACNKAVITARFHFLEPFLAG